MLATSCAADWLHAFESCYMEGNDFGCWRSAVFYTDYGAYDFNNANSGCYGIPVPGMVEFCLDTVEKRAHFRFEGQGKRCLRKDRKSAHLYKCPAYSCAAWKMYEVPCDW